VTAERRLVVLTGSAPEHRYVANRLCLTVPVEGVVVDVAVRRRSLRRAFRGGIRPGVSRVLLELFRRAVDDRKARDAALRKVLGHDLTSRFVAEDRLVHVDGVNSAEALAAVTRLQPDLILVYGTSIVGDEVLGRARRLALNMHTGLSPRYRGTDCAFWPLVNREPEQIGATVHECTPAVDGGAIFAVATADCAPDDGLHDVFARAVAKGADLYVETVERYLAGDLAGDPQDLSSGFEYRGYMRTLLPELRARWALRRGLLRLG
jgi:folate-dependent phosphoribosylglycinamide formyltransferase PurN